MYPSFIASLRRSANIAPQFLGMMTELTYSLSTQQPYNSPATALCWRPYVGGPALGALRWQTCHVGTSVINYAVVGSALAARHWRPGGGGPAVMALQWRPCSYQPKQCITILPEPNKSIKVLFHEPKPNRIEHVRSA